MNGIALSGRIVDGISLAHHADGLVPGDVILDTEGVSFVNSVGMRELIRLIRSLRQRGHAVVMERVAEVLMPQINVFSELASSVTVTSFHAHYACARCGAEDTPLLQVAPNRDLFAAQKAPQLPCPECQAPMDLADFPERYLTVFKG